MTQKVNDRTKLDVISLSRDFGMTSRTIAKVLSLSKSTVNYILAKERKQLPKILFLDVESAPSVAATFGRRDVNLTQNHIIKEGNWLISAAWKFRNTGDDRVHSHLITPQDAKRADDYYVVEALTDAVNSADIVVAHNAKGFDMKMLKSRLVVNHLPSHHSVKVIDTLAIARQMKFPANSLDALAAHLGLGRKTTNSGISLWIGCTEGNREDLKTMLEYNKDDVLLLEQLYDRLQPFNTSTPNFGVYSDDRAVRCTHCGSSDVDYTARLAYTGAGYFAEVQCNSCGAVSKKRKNLSTKEHRSKQLGKA